MLRPKIYLTIFAIGTFLFFDWHARFVFITTGYPRKYGHGKSWNRANKHYKKNWSLLQRLLWIFVFKERYDSKFRLFAYLSYIHFALMIIYEVALMAVLSMFPESDVFAYLTLGYGSFVILRFMYSNAIGKKQI